VGYRRKRSVRVIESIREDMKHHARDVDGEIAVKIEMPCHDAAKTRQQTDTRRRHLELREKFGQSKSQRPVKIKVESAFHLTRFVSGCDSGVRCLYLLRHHHALCFCNNAGTRLSSRIFIASSKSARLCLAVPHARKQIRFCGTAG